VAISAQLRRIERKKKRRIAHGQREQTP